MIRLLALFLLLAPLIAGARDWQARAAGSTLTFTGTAQGEAFDGRFRTFSPTIDFDPASARGRFDVTIDLGSVDTANSERDQTLADAAFFGSPPKPATYTATAFTRLPDGRFRADGTLTLNGIAKPVPLLFAFTGTADGRATLDGETTLDRLDFAVGSGDWADPDMIGRDVRVRTHLVLTAAP